MIYIIDYNSNFPLKRKIFPFSFHQNLKRYSLLHIKYHLDPPNWENRKKFFFFFFKWGEFVQLKSVTHNREKDMQNRVSLTVSSLWIWIFLNVEEAAADSEAIARTWRRWEKGVCTGKLGLLLITKVFVKSLEQLDIIAFAWHFNNWAWYPIYCGKWPHFTFCCNHAICTDKFYTLRDRMPCDILWLALNRSMLIFVPIKNCQHWSCQKSRH